MVQSRDTDDTNLGLDIMLNIWMAACPEFWLLIRPTQLNSVIFGNNLLSMPLFLSLLSPVETRASKGDHEVHSQDPTLGWSQIQPLSSSHHIWNHPFHTRFSTLANPGSQLTVSSRFAPNLK